MLLTRAPRLLHVFIKDLCVWWNNVLWHYLHWNINTTMKNPFNTICGKSIPIRLIWLIRMNEIVISLPLDWSLWCASETCLQSLYSKNIKSVVFIQLYTPSTLFTNSSVWVTGCYNITCRRFIVLIPHVEISAVLY